MSTLTKVAEFTGTRDFEAAALADAWCREQKISVGPLQRGAARGLMRGNAAISKWRNMTKAEHNQLDGRMTGDMRTGPVEIWMRDQPIREQCIRKQIAHLSQVIDESAARIKELEALICTPA